MADSVLQEATFTDTRVLACHHCGKEAPATLRIKVASYDTPQPPDWDLSWGFWESEHGPPICNDCS